MSHTLQPAPLSGVKVLELGALIAPYAASLLAQLGDEVIKVESPKEGDPLHKWRNDARFWQSLMRRWAGS